MSDEGVRILVMNGWKDGKDAFGDLLNKDAFKKALGDASLMNATFHHDDKYDTKRFEDMTSEEKKPTIVIFRKWKYDGEIIAVFPEIPARSSDWYYYQSYGRQGQHAAADPMVIRTKTKPAREEEYARLKQELESRGYVLIIRKRETQVMRKARETEWRNWNK